MLNYFNFKRINDDYLITNDLGKYAFVSFEELQAMINSPLSLSKETAAYLKERGFFVEASGYPFQDYNVTSLLRNSKNYLYSSTSLHIFVVTNACNLNCVYCQANNGSKLHLYMDEKTAKAAVDMALSSPQDYLSFEFQGGEPLLNFDIIQYIVEYAEAHKNGKTILYSIVSNLTLLSDRIIDFIKQYNICISTSLDGFEMLHDHNRSDLHGHGSYSIVHDKIKVLQNYGINVGTIQTTTKASLSHPEEIVDEYVRLGFSTIFLRPLSPLGCAKKEWDKIGYSEEEFITFYIKAFNYILDLNRNGIHIQENYASILLSKIIKGFPANYMELRSPCGAGIGQLAYYVNGDVFTCDEGRMVYEMGDPSFKIGNVFENTYREIIDTPTCRAVCIAGTLESIPSCCDCVYQPYCGVCPVINKALYGDIMPKSPNHYKCKINSGILDFLFSVLQNNETDTISILNTWNI